MGEREVEADEEADERERLHTGHAEAKEEIGGRGAERQYGEAVVRRAYICGTLGLTLGFVLSVLIAYAMIR